MATSTPYRSSRLSSASCSCGHGIASKQRRGQQEAGSPVLPDRLHTALHLQPVPSVSLTPTPTALTWMAVVCLPWSPYSSASMYTGLCEQASGAHQAGMRSTRTAWQRRWDAGGQLGPAISAGNGYSTRLGIPPSGPARRPPKHRPPVAHQHHPGCDGAVHRRQVPLQPRPLRRPRHKVVLRGHDLRQRGAGAVVVVVVVLKQRGFSPHLLYKRGPPLPPHPCKLPQECCHTRSPSTAPRSASCQPHGPPPTAKCTFPWSKEYQG